jgi:hypothetical protein
MANSFRVQSSRSTGAAILVKGAAAVNGALGGPILAA